MLVSSQLSAMEATMADVPASGPDVTHPDQVLERSSRIIARLPLASDTEIEIEFRRSKVQVAEVVAQICELCITIVDTETGKTIKQCQQIPCPKAGGGGTIKPA